MASNIHRSLIWLILASVLLQAAAFAFIHWASIRHSLDFPALTGDAAHYRDLADHLVREQAFRTVVPELSPESVRTPGYPSFLAVLFLITRSWIGAALLQAVIAAVCLPLLTYLIARRLGTHEVGIKAAILLVIEPVHYFLASITLSDIFFTLTLLFFFWLFLKALSDGRPILYGVSGLMLGVAVLTRPIAQFLPLLFLPLIFIRIRDVKRGARYALVFLIGFLLAVGPWSYRNYRIFGSWQLSTVGALNAGYFAILYKQHTTGIRIDTQREFIRESTGSNHPYFILTFEGSPANIAYAKSVVLEDPVGYAGFHLVKTIPFFLNDGLRDISRSLGFEAKPLPNITSSLLRGDIGGLWIQIREGGLDTVFLLAGSSAFGLLALLALVGFLAGVRASGFRWRVVVLALIILYFALLTGPVANARYRMPALPFLLILATFGILYALSKLEGARQVSSGR